jgi:hypothetical protein
LASHDFDLVIKELRL